MSRLFHLRRTTIESFKTTWQKSKFFRFCLISSLIVWVAILVLQFLRLVPNAEGGQYIPLHYNVFFGVDKFGPWFIVFQFPLLGFISIILNNFLAIRFFEKEKALAMFLTVIGLIIQFMLLAAVYFVILLNL